MMTHAIQLIVSASAEFLASNPDVGVMTPQE
jgi:hypothetical protein